MALASCERRSDFSRRLPRNRVMKPALAAFSALCCPLPSMRHVAQDCSNVKSAPASRWYIPRKFIMKKPKQKKAKQKSPRPLSYQSRPQSLPPKRASLFSRTLNLVLTVSGVVGLIIFGDWTYEDYERTIPEINAVDADPATSFVLPFIVTNQSKLLNMTNVTLSCGIDLVTFEDADKKIYGVQGAIANSDVVLKEIDDVPVNYPCNAEGILRAQTDGSLRLGGLLTQPGVVHSQLKVKNMCIWIGVKYKTFWIGRTYISPMFDGSSLFQVGELARTSPAMR